LVTDVKVEYLIGNLQQLGLKEREIYLLLEKLEGFRIYINKQAILYYKIKKRYLQLKGSLPRNEIIKLLAKEFNKSENRIRIYIKRIEKE
jgi:hypothetical protein